VKRAWLWVAVIAAAVVGTALVAALVYIDSIARTLVVRGATYALGVETSLDSAQIGLLSGSFRLAGLEVGNPPGFEEPDFLRVGDARLDLDLRTLRQPTLHVPRFEIRGIEVDLDRQQGKANYAAILDNLARFESEEPEPRPAAAAGEEPGRRFVVEQLVIRDVEAHVRVLEARRVGKVTLIVPEVLMRNLGGEGRPLTAAQLSSVVVKAVLASIAEAGPGLPGDVAGGLSRGLGRLASVSVELPQGGRLANAAAGAVGAGAEAAGEALESGRSSAQGASQRLKDLGGRLRGNE
jgi:hypothetical protein